MSGRARRSGWSVRSAPRTAGLWRSRSVAIRRASRCSSTWGRPTPGNYGPNVADARERGLRLISYDRPGYGASSPHPGRTFADCAADVRAVCTALHIDRLAMWGICGGGPHVLACAALLPDLVTAAASLASLAPYGAEGLDYFAGMGEDNVEDIRLFFKDEAAARAKTDSRREEMLAATAADIANAVKSLLTPADAAVLTGEMAEFLVYSAREGLELSGEGWWEDNC